MKEKAAVLKIVNADIQGLDVNAVKSAFSGRSKLVRDKTRKKMEDRR